MLLHTLSPMETHVAKTTGELFATYCCESAKKMDVYQNTRITVWKHKIRLDKII